MVIEATIDDIIYTNTFSSLYANFLIPILKRQGIDLSTLENREDVDLAHLADVKVWRDIWSAGPGSLR